MNHWKCPKCGREYTTFGKNYKNCENKKCEGELCKPHDLRDSDDHIDLSGF